MDSKQEIDIRGVLSVAVQKMLTRRETHCTMVVDETTRPMLAKSIGELKHQFTVRMESVELFTDLLIECLEILTGINGCDAKIEACKAVMIKLDAEWVAAEQESRKHDQRKVYREGLRSSKWLEKSYVPKYRKLSMGQRVLLYCKALQSSNADLRALSTADEVQAVRMRDVPLYMRDEKVEGILKQHHQLKTSKCASLINASDLLTDVADQRSYIARSGGAQCMIETTYATKEAVDHGMR